MAAKYRPDEATAPCTNGSVAFYTKWIGGPTLALVRNCPTMFGPRTVYVTAEPDTYFTVPAACIFKGKTLRGVLMTGEDGWEFHIELWRYAK